ncbi:hypothetical protein Bca4012_025634 [Brassica carinata]
MRSCKWRLQRRSYCDLWFIVLSRGMLRSISHRRGLRVRNGGTSSHLPSVLRHRVDRHLRLKNYEVEKQESPISMIFRFVTSIETQIQLDLHGLVTKSKRL